jgi:ribosomal protein S18 acetylase RimI-like enzyme
MNETLDHKSREAIYEYVDEFGPVDREQVRDELGFDQGAFGNHVTILKRDGRLKETNGKLETTFEGDFDSDTAKTFSEGDVTFSIRPARQPDHSGLVEVIRETVADGRDVVAENIADILDNERVLFRHDDVQSRVFFVATVDGDVVGWTNLTHPELEKLSHTAELTVGVLPEYRRNGIGSHLLQRGLEWAGEEGYERIYNSIPSTNEKAIEFLKDHGWEIEATREDHYRIDGEYVDEVMMAVWI